MENRNYGIDFLRLVLMYMVCVLHTLGQGGIIYSSINGSIGFGVFYLLEIISYCAVDSFAIISGYTSKNKPQKYEKIVSMWFQVLFFSFFLSIILMSLGINNGITFRNIIKYAFPVSFNIYWYFSAYIVLFFAMPFLNKFLFSINEKTAKKMLLGIFILFSCINLINDSFALHGGYSAIWLILLYCIGVIIKRTGVFEKKNNITLLLLWAVCILLTWIPLLFLNKSRLMSYISPTVLLSGIIMVVLFSRLKPNSKIISKLSPLAFGIYLFQSNPIIWSYMKDAFAFIIKTNAAIGVIYVLGISFLIFVAGLIMEFVRTYISNKIKITIFIRYIVSTLKRLFKKIIIYLD